MIGNEKKVKGKKYRTLDLDYVGVKAPQFSFSRLKGADPVLGVEMASTGEVACFGKDLNEALLKSIISTGFRFPKKNVLLSIGKLEDKVELLDTAAQLIDAGYKLFATEGTYEFLKENKVESTMLYKVDAKKSPNLLDYLNDGKLDFVINIPRNYSHEELTAGYQIRRSSIDLNIPLVTNVQLAKLIVDTIEKYSIDDLEIKEWSGYV